MKTYIAFLRGINVAGHKLIKMEALRTVLTELPIKNISTYIQSGNIIFQSSLTNIPFLESEVSNVIEKYFGFQVPVLICTLEELQKSVSQNPFQNLEDPTQPYVTFLSKSPLNSDTEAFKKFDFNKDNYIIINKIIYIVYDDPGGNSKLTNAIIESKLKVRATTRNWKTVNKLVD
jgi:uncharacterized protein (DUF1697 family)